MALFLSRRSAIFCWAGVFGESSTLALPSSAFELVSSPPSELLPPSVEFSSSS